MTATITRPTTFSSSTGSQAFAHELRQPADLSHLSDEVFIGHLRRYERESVFINGKVASVTVVPDHQSITGYGFVVVRVNTTGGFFTLIDWPRNEFYGHLCSLAKGDRLAWVVTPIEWNESKAYPFMRDASGRVYPQFHRGSKIVDPEAYKAKAKAISKLAETVREKHSSHSRLLNGKPLALPRGWAEARAIEACLESASHRFKHVTNDPVAFFPNGIDG